MADTNELVVASWNTALAFDPGKSEQALQEAFVAVEAIGKEVGVLAMPEFSGRGTADELVPSAHLDRVQADMRALGYEQSVITGGVRDDLVLALWSRIEGKMDLMQLGEGQELPRIRVSGLGDVLGIHDPSDSEPKRIDIAGRFVQHTNAAQGIVVAGDRNATRSKASATTRALHAIDPAVGQIPRLIKINYFNGPPLQKKIGMVVRACAMTRGESLRVMADAGFVDADPSNEPTVFYGRLKLAVDHIMARGLDLENFAVLDRALREDGTPISDHVPVKATVVKR